MGSDIGRLAGTLKLEIYWKIDLECWGEAGMMFGLLVELFEFGKWPFQTELLHYLKLYKFNQKNALFIFQRRKIEQYTDKHSFLKFLFSFMNLIESVSLIFSV